MRSGNSKKRRWLLLGPILTACASALLMAAGWNAGARVLVRADDKVPQDAAPPQKPAKPSDLVVHEWGTFLGMSSANGTALDGMYHEEHTLPAFVHGRGKDQLKLPNMFLKGETPVIYFYTKEKQNVRVGVGFPRGIWTQWYPQAAVVLPNLATQVEQSGALKGGRICWFAEVIPRWDMPQTAANHDGAGTEVVNLLPKTSRDALWNHARDVDAAFVKVTDGARNQPAQEFERFLFYRGLGDAKLPLRIEESRQGTLTLDSELNLGEGVRDIFVLRVERGRGAFSYRPALRPGETASGVIPPLDQAQPLAEFTRKISDELTARLAESGLFAKEARAMVNTWANSYFQTDGIRVLFVLPQSWTDAFIPMTVAPQPRKIVRVMVGRLEMLSADRQRSAEAAIGKLVSRDSTERAHAFRFLHEQGRYVEPIVRHVAKTTKDERIKSLCGRLLLTDFVTDLRAAIHNAADGKPTNVDPRLLRAHLARLLRQAGQNAEALSEAKAALKALTTDPLPPGQKIDDSPFAAEIKGAAFEAMGDDLRAAEVYAHRIDLHARSINGEINEGWISWLREWWVGRAYAQCIVRSGRSGEIQSAIRDRLGKYPIGQVLAVGDRAPRMLLAFLLEAEGKDRLAQAEWQSMIAQPGQQAAAISVSEPAVLAKTGP
jgi:hypothetical protein